MAYQLHTVECVGGKPRPGPPFDGGPQFPTIKHWSQACP